MVASQEHDLSALVPTQSKPSSNGIFASKHSFEDWYNALPVANLSALSTSVIDALEELNRTRISPRLRTAVLEKLVDITANVTNNARLQYRDAVFPLSKNLHELGQQSLTLLNEFNVAHLILIDQLSINGTSVSMINKRKAGHAIHAVMRISLHVIHKSSLLYQNIHMKFWRCLHTCYAFAERNGLASKRFRNILSDPQGRESTIRDSYSRIMLLAVSNLTSASQASIEQIYRASRSWVQKCTVKHRSNVSQLLPGHFLIDIKQTEIPELVESEDKSVNASYVFDLIALKREMESKIETRRPGEHEVTLVEDDGKTIIFDALLLERILTFWRKRISRENHRIEGDHRFVFSIGLSAAHYHEAGNISFGYFLEQIRDDQFSKSREPISSQNIIVGKRKRSQVYEAELVNQSIGGYCLRITDTSDMKIRIGEVLRLATTLFDEKDQVHMLASVRWLNAISPTELMIGVAIIGQDLRPAAVEDDLKGGTCCSALILSDFGAELNDFCQYLVVQSYLPRDTEELAVAWYEDRRYWTGSVEIGELVQKSASFCMYQINKQYISDEDQMIDQAVNQLV